MIRLTMMPAPVGLLALLVQTRRLAQALNQALAVPELPPWRVEALFSDCCELLRTARHAAAMTREIELATFYIELMGLFRGANQPGFEEAGLTYRAPGQWDVDARRLENQVQAYPQVSRLFLKHFLRHGLEPLANRWACQAELH